MKTEQEIRQQIKSFEDAIILQENRAPHTHNIDLIRTEIVKLSAKLEALRWVLSELEI